MLEIFRKIPNKEVFSICWIFLLHYVLITLFQYQILPSFKIRILNLTFPAFQTTQILLVFPLILIISYVAFIRTHIISWKNIGFYKGKNGLLFTILIGFFGGLFQGIFNFYTIDHFVISINVVPNFFEKCLFAPIWEEFFYRVLLLIIMEFTLITLLKIRVFNNPKFNDKFSESQKRFIIIEMYALVVVLNATIFVFGHGIFSSIWIFLSGMIMAIVFLKTRSIIAPIIVHSMSNFVSGGFLFLVIQNSGI